MRRVRKKVLRHAKFKLYAVDACFLLLAITSTTKMIGTPRNISVTSTTYAAPAVETMETREVETEGFIPEEYKNLPYGYTAPTGFDFSAEEMEEQTETSIKAEPVSESLIKSRDWDEGDVLMQIAMAEAEGESVEGKALVMLVVLNRVWTDGFPDDISDVVFSRDSSRLLRMADITMSFPTRDAVRLMRWSCTGGMKARGHCISPVRIIRIHGMTRTCSTFLPKENTNFTSDWRM